ncbi:MAG: glycerol kinase [Planctomycetota bacterium]|jgi:glycerol kinase
MSYILSLDQGTTSSRAIVFDRQGNVIGVAQKEFEQFFPEPGWVEHDAGEIWTSQLGVMSEVLAKAELKPADIAAIGITNQRETTVVWDRKTGKAISKAIVWQDRRTAGHCDQLRADGHAELFRSKTGLILDAYFSGTKVQWILDNVKGARARADAGELAFGTVDSWLLWNLTGGKVHATDASNASRTLLFNIHSGDWDDELLALLNIPRSLLPRVCASSEVVGNVDEGLPAAGVPIAGMAGDQQAALFGQVCTQPGMVKNTFGTGCFMLMNTGDVAVDSKSNLLTTVAWKIGEHIEYALEGSTFVGGAVVQWLRDGLELFASADEIEALALSVPDNGGVFLVPAFAGLGAPHWDQYARGLMIGMTRGTTKGHVARAALEGIAFQVADVLDAMQADAGVPLTELRVDGGASANDLLMQFQADMLGVTVIRPHIQETTALGAAYLAGLAVGYWKNLDDLAGQWQIDRTFEARMPVEEKINLKQGWKRALERSKNWLES